MYDTVVCGLLLNNNLLSFAGVKYKLVDGGIVCEDCGTPVSITNDSKYLSYLSSLSCWFSKYPLNVKCKNVLMQIHSGESLTHRHYTLTSVKTYLDYGTMLVTDNDTGKEVSVAYNISSCILVSEKSDGDFVIILGNTLFKDYVGKSTTTSDDKSNAMETAVDENERLRSNFLTKELDNVMEAVLLFCDEATKKSINDFLK